LRRSDSELGEFKQLLKTYMFMVELADTAALGTLVYNASCIN